MEKETDNFSPTKTKFWSIRWNLYVLKLNWGIWKKSWTNKRNIVEVQLCTTKRTNTKLRCYKLTNLTVFTALFEDVLVGCTDAVLPNTLLRNQTVNVLKSEENTRQLYDDNLRLLRSLVLQLRGSRKLLQQTPKMFTIFISRDDGCKPNQFEGVDLKDLPNVEDLLQLKIFPQEIDIVDGKSKGELARRSQQ